MTTSPGTFWHCAGVSLRQDLMVLRVPCRKLVACNFELTWRSATGSAATALAVTR
jgi:hypothetical protein